MYNDRSVIDQIAAQPAMQHREITNGPSSVCIQHHCFCKLLPLMLDTALIESIGSIEESCKTV